MTIIIMTMIFVIIFMTDLGTDHRQTLTKMTLRKLKEAVFYILGESLCLDA